MWKLCIAFPFQIYTERGLGADSTLCRRSSAQEATETKGGGESAAKEVPPKKVSNVSTGQKLLVNQINERYWKMMYG